VISDSGTVGQEVLHRALVSTACLCTMHDHVPGLVPAGSRQPEHIELAFAQRLHPVLFDWRSDLSHARGSQEWTGSDESRRAARRARSSLTCHARPVRVLGRARARRNSPQVQELPEK
jgi:hypothetical protein